MQLSNIINAIISYSLSCLVIVHLYTIKFSVKTAHFHIFYNLYLYISLEILLRIIMQLSSKRHSSIHTIQLTNKKQSSHSHLRDKNSARPSMLISNRQTHTVNQLADAKNEVYLQHLEQYYQELQKIMQQNNHKRIKSDTLSFIVFLISQLSLSTLKYSILFNFDQTNINVLIQIFSIISFFSGFYLTSLHILTFGFQVVLRISFCLDKLNLILISICIANRFLIQILDFTTSSSFCMQFFVPLWLFYSAATVRIHVMNYKWAQFQIILSKIAHLISFIMQLVLAWRFVYQQKYNKITTNSNSYQIQLIYTVSISFYFVEFYRLISNFDGTNQLRFQYVFQNNTESVIRRKKKELQEKLELWKLNR